MASQKRSKTTPIRSLFAMYYNFARIHKTLKSWIRKSAQDDKWSFCLKAAMMAANRRNDEQTTAPEPHTGIQGQGGARRRQGRSNAGSAGGAFRCSPQSDYDVEGAARGWG